MKIPSSNVGRRSAGRLALLAAIAAGVATYVAASHVDVAFVAFVAVWYLGEYGLPHLLDHPEHRGAWSTHVGLFPAAWIVAVAAGWSLWGHRVWSVVLGCVAAAGLQAVVTHVALRSVVADQRRDLRRRMGLE